MLELCATHACFFCPGFLYILSNKISTSLCLFVRILWVRVRVQVEVRREQPLRESISCDIQFAIRQNQSYSGSIYFKLWYSICQTNISLWHIWIPQFFHFIDLWQLHWLTWHQHNISIFFKNNMKTQKQCQTLPRSKR